MENTVGNANPGLNPKERQRLKTKKFSKDNQNETSCPICQGEYEEDDDVKELPCGHEFHSICIDQWLNNHKQCPICKQVIEL